MGGIFSRPKAPPPPKAVETKVSEREKSLKAKEDEQAQTLKARQRARLAQIQTASQVGTSLLTMGKYTPPGD